jgi:hypothetical protein
MTQWDAQWAHRQPDDENGQLDLSKQHAIHGGGTIIAGLSDGLPGASD